VEKPLYLRVLSETAVGAAEEKRNTGVSPLRPQTTRPPVEMTC
jgi:hypothetical protein